MESIESLVAEINDLCKQYITQKDQFQGKDRMKELFIAIKDQGYNIVAPVLDYPTPEYELLSLEGKKDFEQMMNIKKQKMEAVEKHDFERAADLRDLERELIRKINIDFSQNNENQSFIFSGKVSDLVIFNDPDNLLIALFK